MTGDCKKHLSISALLSRFKANGKSLQNFNLLDLLLLILDDIPAVNVVILHWKQSNCGYQFLSIQLIFLMANITILTILAPCTVEGLLIL